MDIATEIERAAGLMARKDWRACGFNSLVGTTSTYGARAYVRQVVAPGIYRADGLRVNPTADEVLAGMTPDAAAAIMRGVALRARQEAVAYVGGALVSECGQ